MKRILILLLTLGTVLFQIHAQESEEKSPWSEENFAGLKWRSIGPALMSGRIADVAIHPQDDNVWYVAVGSGNVWKTVNAGVTWTPIFDDQSSYSIGCVTIDPGNPNIVWLGTGENVGGRHVGYGDGIYRSADGGQSWENMGLKESEHISRIIVHPDNSDVVWVAAQGPLWNSGGERGIYKTTDGGRSWTRTLGNDEWTGATELVIDPRNPDRLYAATWDRHRTVAAYMGGGPGSGLHRSTDGGETWEKLSKGLPTSNMGKIGLAISPQEPDVLYAAIELDRRTGGVYRSTDRGSSWTKMSDAVSGATGPHYYQELYASPHQFDRLYLVDVRIQISDDGGKTFRQMKEEHKHSDNHSITFRSDDPDYLLVGTDGGLYESFDLAENWRFFENLPVTQFYKIALDDAEPFYNVYGGTQDNSTQGGPSRTDNAQGIQNSDWRVVLDWDGHQPATEPGNPDIMYGQRQEGNLSRIDLKTGEVVHIQPIPGPDEGPERFNWDAPILVSPHDPARIYHASQRLWRSDNRGDSWQAISGDLTRNENRIELPIMGGQQSYDNPWDLSAMSNYNTITSIAESPVQADLIYVGTDDGLIQVTEDGGQNWRRIAVSTFGVPPRSYVNNLVADLHDANTVYAALDNHKEGDYSPYLYKSTDRGQTWTSIGANLPERHLVWRIVQDHVNPGLLFAATEFGIYFTPNGGDLWIELTGGLPTIAFRDIAIQRREDDVVGASFGRSFYVFDDYKVLREVTDEVLASDAALFPLRDAWWYIPRSHLSFGGSKGDQGAGHYVAPNPPFGAGFTYYLKNGLQTIEDQRKKSEKELAEAEEDIPFPGWEALEEERMQTDPRVWTVKDVAGNVVRRLQGPTGNGFHRVAWDLKYPPPNVIALSQAQPESFGQGPSGLLAAPGTYTVSLSKEVDGVITELGEVRTFEVKPLREGALEGADHSVVSAFWRNYEDVTREFSAVTLQHSRAMEKVAAMQKALSRSTADLGNLDQRAHEMRMNLLKLGAQYFGNQSKQQVGEKSKPTINDRMFHIALAISGSTYGPTETALTAMDMVNDQLSAFKSSMTEYDEALTQLGKDLVSQGAPWVEGIR
jgi:photosystem II stability/assembly factor-like uncharacterized protein